MPTLPTDSIARKRYPLFSGLMRYFPAALAGVANHSVGGNEKHIHPGRPYNPDIDVLRHDRTKSTDHADCILRHLVDLDELVDKQTRMFENDEFDRDEFDNRSVEILSEANALAWRALALAQEMHERYGSADSAPAAYWPKPEPEPAPAVTVDPHIVPGPDGWIKHDGTAYSEPADGDMLVQVRLRFDSDESGICARGVGVPARTFRWNHTGSGGDIIAWRPAS